MKRAELTIYDGVKLKKTLWSPWFIQKNNFGVVRVNDLEVGIMTTIYISE